MWKIRRHAPYRAAMRAFIDTIVWPKEPELAMLVAWAWRYRDSAAETGRAPGSFWGLPDAGYGEMVRVRHARRDGSTVDRSGVNRMFNPTDTEPPRHVDH